MAAQLFTLPQQVRVSSSGAPYALAKAYWYRANTTTAQDVYTTSALSVAHAQPVQADSSGQFPAIWLDPAASSDYRVIVKTSAGATLDDYTIPRGPVSTAERATFTSEVFTATAGQTLFTLSSSYSPGASACAVYVNGAKQVVVSDFTETSRTSVTLILGASLGDVVEVVTGAVVSTGNDSSDILDFLQSGTGAVTRTAQDKMREWVSPEDFGAVGNGVTDDTAAIQAAITAIQSSSYHNKELRLGAVAYRITGTLTVTGPVKIVGQGVRDFDSSRPTTIPTTGSWFIHASTTGPLFQFSSTLGTGAALLDFGVFQEGHATPGIGWAPTVKDWVIRNESTQGSLHIRRVHFHNVYKGVLTDYANRPRYEDITGQFFLQAFQFDRIYDIGKLEGLHAWTYWSENDYVLQYQQAHCVAIILLRADGMWMDRLFTFAVKDGIYVGLSTYGGTSRVIYINGMYCDFTARAVVVDSSSPAHLQIGNLFSLGQAWPVTSPATVLTGAAAVHIVSGTNHLVQIGNLFSVLSEGAMVIVAGTSNQVWIESEVIEQYDRAGAGLGAHFVDTTNFVKLGSIPSLAKYSGTAAEITGALGGDVVMQVAQKFNAANTINRLVASGSAAGQLAVVTAEGEATAGVAVLAATTGIVSLASSANALAFYGGASAVKGAVTGAKGGNAALGNLLTYLAARGLLTDSTT